MTVTITAHADAGFPKYFEAQDWAATGCGICKTATGGAYYKASSVDATFTCTGSVAANGTAVISIASGSAIASTAATTNWSVNADLAGALTGLSGKFS